MDNKKDFLVINKNNNSKIFLTMVLSCLAVLCTQAGITMYTTSLPSLAVALKASYFQVTYTFTFYIFGYALAMFFLGGLSDQLGRKKSYLVSVGIFTGASFLLIFATSIYTFVTIRFLQGIGGGGCAVIARASVRDVCEGKTLVKAMSYISITFNVTMGLFQFIGGIVQSYANYKIDFLLMFLLGIGVYALIYFTFQESRSKVANTIEAKQLLSTYWEITRAKCFVLNAVAAGMGYSILLVFNVLGIYYLVNHFKFSSEMIGLLGIYFSFAYLIGGIIVNLALKIYEIDMIIRISKVMMFLSGIICLINALFFQISLVLFMAPFLFGVLSQAIIYPCLMTKAIEPYKAFSGAASSLFGFTQQMVGFLITMFASFLPFKTVYSLALVMFIIGLSVLYLIKNESHLKMS